MIEEDKQEDAALFRKLEKMENFTNKDNETKEFILFVLDKTMRPRSNKKMTLLNYLKEKKINSLKKNIFKVTISIGLEKEVSRPIPEEYQTHISENLPNFGVYQGVYERIFKNFLGRADLDQKENEDNIFEKKFVFDIFGFKAFSEKKIKKKTPS